MRFSLGWVIYFPVGLLALSLICFLIAASWPLYLIHTLGKYTVLWAKGEYE
jgi:hypothetical protein